MRAISKIVSVLFLVTVLNLNSCASNSGQESYPANPKLVLFIAIDQFRYDYLTRFGEFYGPGGFKVFLENGAVFANANYMHSATQTGPGHSVMLSGMHPNRNGIIANNWYDVEHRRKVYCVEDDSSPLLGVQDEGRSPKNFMGKTVGDLLKQRSSKSRVITVANKDRAAILMGGKKADAAYWIVDSMYVTSEYYMKELPDWVKEFNASGLISSYFGKIWERSLPDSLYNRVQGPDDVRYEETGDGYDRTFPHKVDGGSSELGRQFFSAFKKAPFANDVLAEFTMQAIENEKLGQRGVTDILCVGFSANDLVGHAFGPDSHEVMDMCIRTDRTLAKLFGYIDRKLGLNNCLIILTSDHGVAPMPEIYAEKLSDHNDVGRFNSGRLKAEIEVFLTDKYGSLKNGDSWVLAIQSPNIYLNPDALREKSLSLTETERLLANDLQNMKFVENVFTYGQLEKGDIHDKLGKQALASFYAPRSGHLLYQLKEYCLERSDPTGTTHGSPWPYDTHVPLLWFGTAIRPGKYDAAVSIADIAPTLVRILGLESSGEMQGEVLKKLLK